MTIASIEFEGIGIKWPVEGPLVGGFPSAQYKPGTVMAGDNGAEFIFCLVDVVTPYTANQGDMFVWDNTFVAARVGEIAVANEYDIGLNVGSIYLGGRNTDSTSYSGLYGVFQYVFTVGLYGCWFQRAGASLANINAITNATTAAASTIGGTAGRITFTTAVATKSNAMPIGSLAYMPTSKTFTANTVTGTNTLLTVNVGKYLQKGMVLTGSGIPGTTTAPVTFILDINGPIVTMSANATATATGVTVTALTNSTSGTTVNTSPVLSNIPTVVGFYPNQTIAGTGIPASTTILSINGTSPSYTITMSANATATSAANTFISFTTVGMPNYNEVFLNWPYFSAATSA